MPNGSLYPEGDSHGRPPPGRPRGTFTSWLASLCLAVSMLSRLPVPFFDHATPRELGRSVGWYPLAGMLIGGLLATISAVLSELSIPGFAGPLLVTCLALLTGALHLDGVADFADALGSGQPRQRMLEIMKDSRIGAHGACALVLVLLLKAAVFSVAQDTQGPLFWLAIPAISRGVLVPVIAWCPGARASGLGQRVRGKARGTAMLLAATLVGLLAAYAGTPLIAPLLAAAVTAGAVAWLAIRQLGGTTGDVYGTIVELSEVAAAVAWLA